MLKVASHDLPDPARITSHRLRHTFATELLSAGMSLVGVMQLLGHRNHRMTLRYAAVAPEIVAEEYQNALAKLAILSDDMGSHLPALRDALADQVVGGMEPKIAHVQTV